MLAAEFLLEASAVQAGVRSHIEGPVRYLDVEVEDALALAETIEL